MTTNLPRKLPAKGIALLFGVSESRISQLKSKGTLKADSNNQYDVADCLRIQGFRMNEHGERMCLQLYANGTGKVSPPKLRPINVDGEVRVTTLSEDELAALGEEPAPTVTSSPNSDFVKQTRLMELKEKKLESELDLAETRRRKLAGELIERAVVQSSFVVAGTLISNVLQNLPSEIAAIFSTPETKAEVLHKVQTRVDQAQHTLYAALRDIGENDELPEEDVQPASARVG